MLTTPFKYEYECVNQQDEIVANGEFCLYLPIHNIRNHAVVTRGYFGLFEHERDVFKKYRGSNHCKKIQMKITNMHTKSVRYVE